MRIPRTQPRITGAAIVLLTLGAGYLFQAHSPRHAALLLVGAGFGLVLYHAGFGFTSAFRALLTTGDGRGLRAQMLMLAVAMALFAPVIAFGDAGGAVAPLSLSVFAGALIFGIGMQLGGG